VTAESLDFEIPVRGFLNNKYNDYDWNIDWGYDEKKNPASGTGPGSNIDISHTFPAPGSYIITITPNGSADAWLAAFGFDWAPSTYKQKITEIISPLTPLMTRKPEQISNLVPPPVPPPDNEWSRTFNGCQDITMGDNFKFSDSWNNIAAVGHGFADGMFADCSGNAFTMNGIFNLPTGIVSAGDYFAAGMFYQCSGSTFTMNNVFNLPSGITTVGNMFVFDMFRSCFGSAFNMNNIFNLPPGITTVGNNFAQSMFVSCAGGAFTMNNVFNLPSGITTVGDMFVFSMFQGCNGDAFKINDVFKFPVLSQNEINKSHVFFDTFINLKGVFQPRTALSIINGNPTPNTPRGTFTTNGVFSDLASVPINWGGFAPNPSSPAYTFSGAIQSYNPGNPTTVRLTQGGETIHTEIIPAANGIGQVTQTFSIDGVAPGVYSLVISKTAHTKFTINTIIIDEADVDLTDDSREAVKVISLTPGAVTGSGIVDIFDLLAVNNHMNKTSAQAAAAGSPHADINGDGIIDIFDLLILMENMNKGAVVVE
jgi:hypothetical protein